MRKIEFEKMNDSKKLNLYKCLWDNNRFIENATICKTIPEGGKTSKEERKPSHNSYSFTDSKISDKKEIIAKAFGIKDTKNRKIFDEKFKTACDGAGQEGRRITTLHSSSLCALLFFYNVENEPLILTIEGKEIEFNYSTFEFKNPVIDKPSNIDVLLVSKDKKTVLFLESKFAEYYLSSGKSNLISYEYRNADKCRYGSEIYDLVEKKLKLEISPGTKTYKSKDGTLQKKEGFYLKEPKPSANYLEGIKQMISHYVGIRNRFDLLNDKNHVFDNEIEENISQIMSAEDCMVYLGEILFDGFDIPNTARTAGSTTILKNYKETYTNLSKVMNKKIKESNIRFRVLEEDFGYKQLAERNKDKISKDILEFYNL